MRVLEVDTLGFGVLVQMRHTSDFEILVVQVPHPDFDILLEGDTLGIDIPLHTGSVMDIYPLVLGYRE